MATGILRGRGALWEGWLRRAPTGVVVMSTLLGLVGAGFVIGGTYLGLARLGEAGWAVWVGALLVGPLALYVAIRLLSLTHWAWWTMVLLIGLLLISSVARLLATPGIPTVPLVEIVLELGALAYLARPTVRLAFLPR